MPYNIMGPSTCLVASLTATLTCTSGGDGTTTAEQLVPVRPDGSSGHIQPGETMYLKSVQTGKFCHAVAVGGQQQIACDQATPASAAAITYTGVGMALNGQPFVNPGDGTPAYFASAGSAGSAVTFLRPPILTSTALDIYTPNGGYLRADSATDFVYVGNGTGLAPPEQFTMQVRCCGLLPAAWSGARCVQRAAASPSRLPAGKQRQPPSP
jgi:hypothetical protein